MCEIQSSSYKSPIRFETEAPVKLLQMRLRTDLDGVLRKQPGGLHHGLLHQFVPSTVARQFWCTHHMAPIDGYSNALPGDMMRAYAPNTPFGR